MDDAERRAVEPMRSCAWCSPAAAPAAIVSTAPIGIGAAQRVRAMQQRAHGLAVHVLHREEVRVAELSDVVDLRDVGMLELRREPRLVEEHPHERARRSRGRAARA